MGMHENTEIAKDTLRDTLVSYRGGTRVLRFFIVALLRTAALYTVYNWRSINSRRNRSRQGEDRGITCT